MTTTGPFPQPATEPRSDRLLRRVVVASGALCAAVLAMIVVFVVVEAGPALGSIAWQRFLTDDAWRPTAGSFGMLPMIVGSLAVTGGAALVAIPAGLATALFLHGFAPPSIANFTRRIIDVLAGIPSVVYGLWGITVLVPLIAAWAPTGSGHSLLAGVLVVALMTLPLVVVAADAALAQVPPSQRAAAAALGLSRWGTLWHVQLPQAQAGVVTGCLLQIARAIGETMAVLMVCGNVVALPDSLFAPVRTLTANIALEMGYATSAHRSVLFVSGLLLLLVVAALMVGAHRVGRRRKAP